MNEKNFCIAPFIQIVNDARGGGGPCPYNSECWTFKEKTILGKWKSEQFQKLRQEFIQGKKPDVCWRCWSDEDAGKKSLRQRLYNFSSDDVDAHVKEVRDPKTMFENVFKKYVESGQYQTGPKTLTIKPGNLCNLSCRSCNPTDSSQWVSMLNRLQKTGELKFIQNEKNTDMSDAQIQDIVDYSENLQRLEIFGGEPFYHKSVRQKLLPKLIEKGHSQNITLYFNTNGNLFDEEIAGLSKKFKKLEIRASIDGTHAQFDYLRHNANYNQVIENCKKFAELDNSNFELVCTISPYNFLYLDDYEKEFKALGWTAFYNMTSGPDYMLLYNIPEEVKNHVNLSNKFKEFETYIKTNKSNPKAWEKFVAVTKTLDADRKQDFKLVFPRFYDLVRNHF